MYKQTEILGVALMERPKSTRFTINKAFFKNVNSKLGFSFQFVQLKKIKKEINICWMQDTSPNEHSS